MCGSCLVSNFKVMLHLPAYIPALLHRYDCVVIPDLGGFVANYSPARLDKAKGVIYPPSKGIIFNKNLVRNDGLLVNEIAQVENISYQEALDQLTAFVQESKMRLAQGGRIELEGLGYLYFDGERNIQYLQYQTENFLNDSFGLAPVMAVPRVQKVVELVPKTVTVTEEKPVEVKEKQENKEATIVSIKEVTQKVKTNRKKYYWAAAVLLPILFYAYWLPFQTPMMTTGQFSWNYLNPFGTYAIQTYQERQGEESQTAALLDDNKENIPAPVQLPEISPEQPASETTYVPSPLVTDDKKYHIIAGCFINYDNALTQISELNAAGNKAYLFGQAGGFYRVALGSYASETEAIRFLQEKRLGGQPNAWLLEE